ncbi:major facilitator superfamily transporter [Gluconacetobacter johannae DSM 13595]|uniref:MFS transporter n=1 Tax=Gluconacetobacter johannae TaxID=112140 RepID=A0A7W4J9S2_9PROT|nr:MFS transporter [Gluconacetobacter johannae]MBB2177188.1 MFS transporter [Gluconacetobacter johannae]GBQ82145.1 major facilitator superfamily transporter [Gluconacetobacter johannae DSM 13595]
MKNRPPPAHARDTHDIVTVRTPRLARTGRLALVLLVAGGALNYVDRATLAVANPLIRHDLGVSVAGMGALLSAFLWAYALAQLPAGLLVDRLGPRRVLSAGLAIWSLAQCLGGLVTGFGAMFATRLLLGAGESPQSPASARVVRDWFAVPARGTATGIWNSASTLGSAISVPLLTVLMLSFGWRWMFGIMGVVGLVFAGLFWLLHRDPADIALTEGERAYLRDDVNAVGRGPVSLREWRRLFAFRTTWGMMAGFFGCIYVLWIYNAWLPGYLEMDRHMSIARTGWIAAIPFLFGIAGSLCGGRLVDMLVRHGVSPVGSRKYPMIVALLGTAGATILAAEVASNAVAVGCISVAMFLLYVCTATAWAMAPVAAPGRCTASIGAMQNCGGYIGGAFAPVVTGLLGQATGSFRTALWAGAGVAILAALAYGLLIGDPIDEAALARETPTRARTGDDKAAWNPGVPARESS